MLSTIGLDGFPNARNIVLKEIRDPYLVITGPTNSRKGVEITSNPRVALTFWWEESNRQIRIQGKASKIPDEDAEFYFSERSKESQAVSTISEQGKPLISREKYESDLNKLLDQYQDNSIPRPTNWSGFQIEVERAEFFEFKATRNHFRLLFSKTETGWKSSVLQP